MLKLVIDKLEDVEEAQRPLYGEKDGKFQLLLDGFEDPAPLKRNLEAARRAERAMKAKVDAWEKLGKSDEEIAALIKKHEDTELSEAERKGEFEKIKAQILEKNAAEIKKWEIKLAEADARDAARMRQIERHLVDSSATAAIAAAKGTPDLLLPIVKMFLKATEEEGEFKVHVVDAKGDPRVNAKGDPMTIDELLADMKSSEKYSRAFDGSGQSGGGSQPGNGSGISSHPAGVPKSWAEAKTETEKVAFIRHQSAQKAAKAAAS